MAFPSQLSDVRAVLRRYERRYAVCSITAQPSAGWNGVIAAADTPPDNGFESETLVAYCAGHGGTDSCLQHARAARSLGLRPLPIITFESGRSRRELITINPIENASFGVHYLMTELANLSGPAKQPLNCARWFPHSSRCRTALKFRIKIRKRLPLVFTPTRTRLNNANQHPHFAPAAAGWGGGRMADLLKSLHERQPTVPMTISLRRQQCISNWKYGGNIITAQRPRRR